MPSSWVNAKNMGVVKRDRNSAQTVEKAMQVLRLVGRSDTPLGISDIAAATGFSPTAVQRLVRALEKEGALSRDEKTRLRVGWMIRGLVPGHEWHDTLKDIASLHIPSLQQLCGGETVGLYTAVGTTQFICVHTLTGLHGLTWVEPLYQPVDMALGATSLVFLAQRLTRYGDSALLEFLNETLLRMPNPPEVCEMVQRVRDVKTQGYASSESLRFAGLSAISVPIPSQFGETMAALTVSGPSTRFTEERNVRNWPHFCQRTARKIREEYIQETSRRTQPPRRTV